MTDREKIMSNDYYDLTLDYVLPPYLMEEPYDMVYQPVDRNLGIVYINREDVPPLNLKDYTYPIIPKLYGLMQRSRAGTFDSSPLIASGIARVQREPLSLTGQGVVMGFLDTGIRYEEAVFRREDGRTRILNIWDQTIQTGEPPEGILYGTEYDRETIDRALASDNPREIVPSYDENGHGTALASVAAGSMLGNGLEFLGAAPEADIVVVKLREAKPNLKEFYLTPEEAPAYAESDILVALSYLANYAIALTRPLVICIGLGTNMGDHEGHSILADYLNSLAVRRNCAIVVCGGNEGNSRHHYMGTSVEGLTETTDNVEIRVGEGEQGFVTELWGSISANHAISIQAPGGEVTPRVDFRGQESREFTFIYERSRIQVDHVLVEQRSGEELIFLRFLDPTPGVWTIRVYIVENSRSQSSFHMWLPITDFLSGDSYFLRPYPYITLTEPSNGREITTVSAYNDVNNSFWTESGRGYTRMGQIKPDICAPGVNIDTISGAKTGSSLAAALCAGAAAQFMQWAVVEGNRPWVENRELKNYLIRGAARTVGDEYPSREWGYGRLDIAGTFDTISGV